MAVDQSKPLADQTRRDTVTKSIQSDAPAMIGEWEPLDQIQHAEAIPGGMGQEPVHQPNDNEGQVVGFHDERHETDKGNDSEIVQGVVVTDAADLPGVLTDACNHRADAACRGRTRLALGLAAAGTRPAPGHCRDARVGGTTEPRRTRKHEELIPS